MESILISRQDYIIISYEIEAVYVPFSFCFPSRYVHKEGRPIPLSISKVGTWLIKSLLSLDGKEKSIKGR
jgi:hypothetical protein